VLNSRARVAYSSNWLCAKGAEPARQPWQSSALQDGGDSRQQGLSSHGAWQADASRSSLRCAGAVERSCCLYVGLMQNDRRLRQS